LRIGMLLDTSNSNRDRIKFEQDAANNFLFSVLRRGKDEAFVMTFDDEPQVVQAFTPDTGKLRDQILRTRAGGGTAVYDAIYQACEQELSHPPRPPGDQPDVVRRVMILISDGEDNLSTHTRAEAIEMAQRSSVVIYTISTSTQWVTLDDPSKDRTGNRKYHLTDGDKILQALAGALSIRTTWTIWTSRSRISATNCATNIPLPITLRPIPSTAGITRSRLKCRSTRATRCGRARGILRATT
jgi:VWFA-related protein